MLSSTSYSITTTSRYCARNLHRSSSFLFPQRHFYTYALRIHAELDTRIFCSILHYSSGDNPPPLPHTQQLKKNISLSICKRRLSFTPQFKTLSLIHNQSFFSRSLFFSIILSPLSPSSLLCINHHHRLLPPRLAAT